MMGRQYTFLMSFVQKAVLKEAVHHHGQQQLREVRQSSLGGFVALFFEGETVKLVEGRNVLQLNYEDFMKEMEEFELNGESTTTGWMKRSFKAFLYHCPDKGLWALGTTMGLVVATVWRRQNNGCPPGSEAANQLDRFLDRCQIKAQFHRVAPQICMAAIRTSLVKKFVSVKGHVVKARPKRLRVVTVEFTCQKCGACVVHEFEQGRFSLPEKCGTSKCRSKNFQILRSSAKYINVQEVRLQEAQEESIVHAGRTPRQIEVDVTHDLVDRCRPGDVVSIACIVRAVNSALAEGKRGKRAQETSTYKLYLEAHSITTTSSTIKAVPKRHKDNKMKSSSVKNDVNYTDQQLQNILEVAHADHRYFGMVERRAFPFDLLVRSLCPSIIGHDMVKAGVVLCLLGGTPPSSTEKANLIRSNSHMLIVGDPGMGKSQMLLATTQVTPRSVYVGGNTTTTTGLTVSLTKEPGGEAGIEAGALVLADQGVCCIDEFDKMPRSHQDGLLEAMEQQQISIAKAGVVASMPARCSVVAAANPRHGSYNLGKTVAENLNMSTPILSRFDLVFILRDRADSGQDKRVSSNIMNLYKDKSRTAGPTAGTKRPREPFAPRDSNRRSHNRKEEGNNNNNDDAASEDSDARMPMKDRLEWVAQFQTDPLPAELVKDYIRYAREYCKPKLTAEAARVLKHYFMNLR